MMSPEQERIVVENEKLVCYVFSRFPKSDLTIRYREDFLSEGRIGLIKAAKSFDENRGHKFSTFAYYCIVNQMRIYLRGLKKFDGREVSISMSPFQSREGESLTFEEMVADKFDYSDLAITEADMSGLQLTATERTVLQYRIKGYGQASIAEKMSVSQSCVSRALKRLKKKLCG